VDVTGMGPSSRIEIFLFSNLKTMAST